MLLIQNSRGLLMDNNCRQYGFRGNRSGIIPESATGIRWLKERDLRLGIFAKIQALALKKMKNAVRIIHLFFLFIAKRFAAFYGCQ